MKTPIASRLKLSIFRENLISDPLLYKSIVVALLYVAIIRPNIAYNVNKVCLFIYNSEEVYRKLSKELRYLNGTVSFGLHLRK